MEYTHIIHLSDIHIRRGNAESSRVDVYQHVFHDLAKEIENIPSVIQNTALIVVTGDIFHDKGIIEPFGIQLFYQFLNATASYAPTIIIAGNHDIKQEDTENRPGILDVLISRHKPTKYPIHFLRRTGHNIFGKNIGIGHAAIQDILAKGSSQGLEKEVIPFPDPNEFPENYYKIALCHVSIDEALPPKMPRKSPIGLPYFKGYDFVLLGDIHKRQFHTTGQQIWGYAGSIIQQNFGETPTSHGFLIWDLKNRSVEERDIKPPHAFLTLTYPALSISVDLPRTLDARIMTKNTYLTQKEKTEAREAIEAQGFYLNSVVFIPIIDEDGKSDIQPKGHQHNQTHLWVKYLETHFPEDEHRNVAHFITDPSTFKIDLNAIKDTLSVPKHTTIKARQEVWLNDITTMKNYGTHSPQREKAFQIQYVKWGWLLCFGENNIFDFRNMHKKVILINGKTPLGNLLLWKLSF